jgi:xylan 1,4-beta-xylosidase
LRRILTHQRQVRRRKRPFIVTLPWAGWTREVLDGSLDNVTYDYSEVDHLTMMLNRVNVLPYWSYCYLFKPFQNPPGEFRGVPGDMELWGKLVADYVRHTMDGVPETQVGYHEIYNEPDNAVFFDGVLEDYLRLYEEGSRAISGVSSDALIGGPALAFMNDWIEPFLNRVERNHLPLDFFSFHFYGTGAFQIVAGQAA